MNTFFRDTRERGLRFAPTLTIYVPVAQSPELITRLVLEKIPDTAPAHCRLLKRSVAFVQDRQLSVAVSFSQLRRSRAVLAPGPVVGENCMIAAALVSIILLAQAPQPAPSVKALEWMTGCWITGRGETSSWESWTRASDEVMLGVSYTLRAGIVTEFEFLRVAVRQGRLVYLAQPNGNPPTAFELVAGATPREAIFANPTHDFPKRVAYRATPSGLLAWIDGGEAASSRRIEYPMTRVSCDSAPR